MAMVCKYAPATARTTSSRASRADKVDARSLSWLACQLRRFTGSQTDWLRLPSSCEYWNGPTTVGMEKPRPGGKLNLNPKAARLTWVLVSLASMEMEGRRLVRALRRRAREARAVSPAVSTPRFAVRPSFTASASVSVTGPAGILSDCTLP